MSQTPSSKTVKKKSTSRASSSSFIPSIVRQSTVWQKLFPSAPREEKVEEVTINQIGPGKVTLAHSEAVKFAMEPGPDGDTLEVKRIGVEQEKAVTRIQAAFRRYKARALYESLQTLSKMNLEIKWPSGSPFLGLLIVKVNSIKNLSGVRHALLRAKLDDDQSVNVIGFKDKDHIIRYDYRATFVYVVLKSNSVFTIEAYQGLEVATRSLGKAHIPVSTLQQGTVNREVCLRSSNQEVVGMIEVTIGYQWLRGTTDYGGYNGPESVVVPSRKIRGSMPGQAVERLWKVNHWVCSHDNVWCTSPDFATIVLEAVRRNREKDTSYEVVNSDGEKKVMDPSAASNFLQGVNKDEYRTSFTSIQLLHNVLGTTNIAGLPTIDSLESISSSAVNSTFGKEDWHKALEELEGLSFETTANSSSLQQEEEEENFDYSKPSADFKSVESSESSSTTSHVSEPRLSTEGTPKHQQRTSMTEIFHSALKLPVCKHQKRIKPTSPVISGKFEYGVYRPASERGVHLFLRKYDNTTNSEKRVVRPIYLGEHQTTKHGRLEYQLPQSVAPIPGLYHALALLPDDNTFGHGSLYLLEKGTKCVVFDLDGTITTSDIHVVAQTLLDSVSASTVIGSSLGKNYDLRARPNALACVRTWAAKGYQVIYLSGRQGSAYNMTLEWLVKHEYPPGPIHLTRTHLPTLPVYVSVGHFKIKYMKELKSKGLELFAAYGNTGTDIKAYEAVGIPKERTFIVGSNGGRKGTVAVKNFTTHLLDVVKFPDSEKPIPYTELLTTTPWQKPGILE